MVEDKPLTELRMHPDNPRTISGSQLRALASSLEQDPDMLQARPLIALPTGEVIAGNQRLAAAKELGWETIPTITVDLDEARAKQWMLRDNNPYGEWEAESLAALLDSLEPEERELVGFTGDELDRMLGEMGAGHKLTDDQAAKYTQQYEEQYGVIILCENEAKQEELFNKLTDEGHDVRVVVT